MACLGIERCLAVGTGRTSRPKAAVIEDYLLRAIGAGHISRLKPAVIEDCLPRAIQAGHAPLASRGFAENAFQVVVDGLRRAGQDDPAVIRMAQCLFEDGQVTVRDETLSHSDY